ncbi:MAG: histidine phosphatase family protein [Gammaproteobacteria bacterium]|nr:histidine phosphatase family protein [Gammaproteobacteria bacterium]
MNRRFFLALIATLSSVGSPTPAQDTAVLTGKALVQELRAGGYNVYFRHAATDWSQNDHIRKAGDWASCDPSRVRQLSNEGRRSARAVGDAVRALKIPVGRILASPYCRTVDTAKLMDLGPVETTTDIVNLRVAAYFGGRDAIAKRARAQLATPPANNTNTVLVAHGNVARHATQVYPDEGEGIVFRPQGNGRFIFVGRLTPAQWVQLVDEQLN